MDNLNLHNILNLPTNELEPGNSPEAQEELEKRLQEEYDLCAKFKRVFSSKEGQDVLKHIASKTVDGPTWNFNLSAEYATINGYAREGQNSIYRYVVEMIEKADKLKEEINKTK